MGPKKVTKGAQGPLPLGEKGIAARRDPKEPGFFNSKRGFLYVNLEPKRPKGRTKVFNPPLFCAKKGFLAIFFLANPP